MANLQTLARTADPLSTLEKDNSLSRVEMSSVLAWLLGQLNAWEFAKISQGGHTQTEVPLRRVFVDLPVSTRGGNETDEDGRMPFLAQLLKAKPISVRNAKVINSISERNHNMKGVEFDRPTGLRMRTGFQSKHDFSAAILIGGPGQGKSTLGQLACQLHRAALLKPFEHRLKSADKELVRSFESEQERAGSDSLNIKKIKYRLFPLQISLPDLSAWLSVRNQPQTSHDLPVILQFVAALTSSKECSITAATLNTVVTKLPILLVLDGFDEVGATEDRERLIWAANELLAHIAQHDGAAQVLATTRPQGYMGEFARLIVGLAPCFLVPLTKDEALQYAEKLLHEKIPNPDEREQTLSRIREAASEQATERLLTTPLQVTILSALVHQRGRAPRERWNLFSGYFAYTYARETERNTYASALLRDYKIHIEQIHARVALLLQVEAERDGGAAARMPRERLKEIINAVLTEAGYEDTERIVLVRDIAKAAEERLVFLVEPEPGSFGFEIRSFQEFMSAWAITSGSERYVLDRLRAICRAPMFRNVVLFALSRLFSDGSHLRDAMIEEVMPDLDHPNDDVPASRTKSGALLALETLEEGAALSYPKWARQLMSIAAKLLELPPSNEHRRLARAGTIEIRKVLRDTVEQSLLDGSETRFNHQSVWIVVLEALNRNNPWAREIADQLWEKTTDLSSVFLALKSVNLSMNEWLRGKILEYPSRVSPDDFLGMRIMKLDGSAGPDWVTVLCEVFSDERVWHERGSHIDAIKLSSPHALTGTAPLGLLAGPAEWKEWCCVAEFECRPSATTLAAALDALAESNTESTAQTISWRSTWPLAACIRAASNAADLSKFAGLAREGILGDFADWKRAEQSWRQPNLQPNWQPAEGEPPFSLNSIFAAPPIWLLGWWNIDEIVPAGRRTDALRQLNNTFNSSGSAYLKDWSGRAALSLYRTITAERAFKSISPIPWLESQPSMIGLLIPRPPHMSERVWNEMFDIAPVELGHVYPVPLEVVSKLVLGGTRHPFMLRLAASSLRSSLKNKISETTRKALEQILADVPDAKQNLDALMIEAFLGTISPSDDETLARKSAESVDREIYFNLLVQVIGHGNTRMPVPRRAALIAYVLENTADQLLRARAISQLRNLYQEYKSPLVNPAIWDALALKLPRPQALGRRSNDGFNADVVSIRSIEISDVCGIKSLTLQLRTPEAKKGQWTILIGPNGAGKTTILRSICLALRNTDDRGIWPRNSLSLDWIRTDETGIRAPEGSVSVKLSNFQNSTKIRTGATRTFIREVPQDANIPVFAYGCRRGSALGGVRRQVDLSQNDGPEVATLFDDSAELIHAETWLISLDSAASQDLTASAINQVVLNALASMLDVNKVEVAEQRVWVHQEGRPRLPLDSLSDGYLTNAGWFLDLIARWVDAGEKNGARLDEKFLERMTGIVLIDELDLHLHPKWQVEVIKRTRELLPAMSFFVTTHNPMTLVGAKAEEIWILSNDEQGIKVHQGVDRPILLTGGEIYQEYFGMTDVYPSQLGEKIRRYNFLSRFSLRSQVEDSELEMLIKELKQAGMLPSWTVVARKVDGV